MCAAHIAKSRSKSVNARAAALFAIFGASASFGASIIGTVIDFSTRQPVPHAELVLSGAGKEAIPIGLVADAKGQFTFRDVADGEYLLQGSRAGYYSFRVKPDRRIKVAKDVAIDPLTVELAPTGSISGAIRYEDGAPAAQASVRAFLTGDLGVLETYSAIADENGRYRIGGLFPGSYQVVASVPPAFSGLSAKPRRQPDLTEDGQPRPISEFAAVWYKDSLSRASSSQVGVHAGEHVQGIDISLSAVPRVALRGRILSGAATVAPAAVNLRFYAAHQAGMTSETDRKIAIKELPDGRFEIPDLTAGTYFARAETADSRLQVNQSVEVGRTDTEVDLTLEAPLKVEGLLKFEDGSYVSNASTVELGDFKAQAEKNGRFRFNGVDRSYSYSIVLDDPQLYVKSAALNGARISSALFRFGRGVTAILELVVGKDPGEVSITIDADETVPPGEIEVVDFYLGENPIRAVRIDSTSDSQIVFNGVAPGKHRFVAWSGPRLCDLAKPDACANRGAVIEVEPNGSQSLTLKPER